MLSGRLFKRKVQELCTKGGFHLLLEWYVVMIHSLIFLVCAFQRDASNVGMIMFAVSDHAVSAFVLLYVQSLYGLMSTYA